MRSHVQNLHLKRLEIRVYCPHFLTPNMCVCVCVCVCMYKISIYLCMYLQKTVTCSSLFEMYSLLPKLHLFNSLTFFSSFLFLFFFYSFSGTVAQIECMCVDWVFPFLFSRYFLLFFFFLYLLVLKRCDVSERIRERQRESCFLYALE